MASSADSELNPALAYFLPSLSEQFWFIPVLYKPKVSGLQFALFQPIGLFARYVNSSTRNR